jgi:hypothetical protein
MIVRRLDYRKGAVIAAPGPNANRNRRSEGQAALDDQGGEPERRRGRAEDQNAPKTVRDVKKFADHGGSSCAFARRSSAGE